MLDVYGVTVPHCVLLASVRGWSRTTQQTPMTNAFQPVVFLLFNKENWNNRKTQGLFDISQLQEGLFLFFFQEVWGFYINWKLKLFLFCTNKTRSWKSLLSAPHVNHAHVAWRRKRKAGSSKILCLCWCLLTQRYSDQTLLPKMSFSWLLLLQISESTTSSLFSQQLTIWETADVSAAAWSLEEGSQQASRLPLLWLCQDPSTAVDFTYFYSNVLYIQWDGPVWMGKTGWTPKFSLSPLISKSS